MSKVSLHQDFNAVFIFGLVFNPKGDLKCYKLSVASKLISLHSGI